MGDRTTLPLQYGNLTIDHPRDKDYYRIQNVGPNEKITMSVYLYGNNVEKYDKYSFELWRLKDRTRLDDGWYEFHFASYEYKNAAMTTAMDRKGAKVMSFVTENVGTTENDTTYYLVVRESEHNTIVDPNSYSLACTKIPLDHMEAEDAYEIRDGNNLTNDFILANGLDYTTLLADNAPVNAVLDNFLDVDWYRICLLYTSFCDSTGK